MTDETLFKGESKGNGKLIDNDVLNQVLSKFQVVKDIVYFKSCLKHSFGQTQEDRHVCVLFRERK